MKEMGEDKRDYARKQVPVIIEGKELNRNSTFIRSIRIELKKMQRDDKYTPKFRLVRIAVEMTRQGADMEELRKMFFDLIPQDTWVKFKRCMFAIQVTSSEDVGHELLLQRDVAIQRIRAEIDKMKDLQSTRPMLFHKEIIDAEKKVAELHSDTAKRLVDIGAVGKKKSSGSVINIYNYIPRPSKPTTHQKVLHAQVLTQVDQDREAVEQEVKVIEEVPHGDT